MKLVIQRVNKAQVEVENKVIGKIDKGLFVLIGVKKGDTKEQAEALANKLLKLRVMSDEKEKMNLAIQDTRDSILVVSQFTLYANTKDGNRPSFIDAALPDSAREIYEYFVDKLKLGGVRVETGEFGSYMKIQAELDGPVTIILEN